MLNNNDLQVIEELVAGAETSELQIWDRDSNSWIEADSFKVSK